MRMPQGALCLNMSGEDGCRTQKNLRGFRVGNANAHDSRNGGQGLWNECEVASRPEVRSLLRMLAVANKAVRAWRPLRSVARSVTAVSPRSSSRFSPAGPPLCAVDKLCAAVKPEHLQGGVSAGLLL